MILHWTASEASTLRAALTRLLPFSGQRLDTLMRQGLVRRDGVKLRANASLQPGDSLEILLPRKFLPKPVIAAEDSQLLVVEKAPGIEVTGESGLTLEVLLREFGYPGARACHRLDVWTGGLVIFALTQEAEGIIHDALAQRRIQKTYQAITVGIPQPSQAVSTVYLTNNAHQSLVHIHAEPCHGAPPCVTGYRVLSSFRDLALVEVDLFTGRTHQIRAHMAYLGYPLLGDDKYGSFEKNRLHGLTHPCLWSVRLGFPAVLPEPLQEWSGRVFTSEPRFPAKVYQPFLDN